MAASNRRSARKMKLLVSFAFLCLTGSSLSAQNSFDDFTSLSASATAARQANNVPHAIERYRQALKLNPKWDEGWWFLGSLLYDTDQYANARDALVHFVQLHPDAAPGLGLLGLCEFETGDYAHSLENIERSLTVGAANSPEMDRVLQYHEAQLLTRTGDFDKAVQKYSALLRSGAQSPSLLASVGLAALRTPLLPKDIPAGQQDIFVLAGKASVYIMSGDIQNAHDALVTLVERYPKTPNVHYLYGVFLLGSNPADAAEQFQAELGATSSNPTAAAMLAWVLLRRGDFRIALPYAEKAATGEPKSSIAQFVLGRLLVETGSVPSGIEHLQIAEKLDPAFLESHLSLATAYSRIGRIQEARRERQTSFEMTKEANGAVQP